MAFIDLEKAYDSVIREVLWDRLKHIGVNSGFILAKKSIQKS